jgi:K+-sensing histidine kinase KdpD
MLTNLVDNAVKFNIKAGSVTVGFARKDDRDIISVTDTGEGISRRTSPANLRAILPHRPRPLSRNRRDGFGLGNRQTSGAAARRRSFRRFQSGKGSIFSVELPSKSAQRMIHPASE